MKAFVFDPLWDELATQDIRDGIAISGLELTVIKEIAPLRECTALFEGDADRILCLNPDYVGWKLAADDYKDIPHLKGILCASTSYSWIDTTYADSKQIPICNIRNFSTEAVAEWAITMMHNLARQTPRLIKDGFPLDFDADFMKYRGIELHGKTAGIIGLGNIGSAIAKRCAGLGMQVNYWSKSPKDTPYKFVELQRIFETCDVIFPALALNDETKVLITDEYLHSMKPTTIVMSVVHGLCNEQLLLHMVKNNQLFGYGFEAAPNSFAKYDGNVWAAPAYAWVTDGSMNNSMQKFVENMLYAAKGEYPNKVNI